jgi:RND superfamily putative drug exporter
MLVCFLLLPGSLLISLAGSVMVVTAVSVAVATYAGPAMLTLLGPNVNRWSLKSKESPGMAWLGPVQRALRHPAIASIVIGIAVLAIAAPARGLDIGPPSPSQLPEDDQARLDFELIEDEVGPGWETPFVIVAEANNGSIADSERLAVIAQWQEEIAADPGVRTVFGPGNVGPRVEPLRRLGRQLMDDGPDSRINRGLKQLSQATIGARRLVDGLLAANAGAELIANAPLPPASQITRFQTGAKKASDGAQQVALGSVNLSFGVDGVRRGVKNNTKPSALREQSAVNDIGRRVDALSGPANHVDKRLRDALDALQGMTVGKTDAEFAAALAAVQDAAGSAKTLGPDVSSLREVVGRAIDDAASLARGLTNLENDLTRIHGGSKQLVIGNRTLSNANRRLADGTKSLDGFADGIERLAAGAAELASGLTRLGNGAGRLSGGLNRANRQGERANERLGQLRRASPGLFDSGYFVLSSLDGAPEASRERAAQGINVDDGGNAAAILAIPRDTVNTPGIAAVNDRLDEDAAALAEAGDLTTGVTGGAATLNDYDTATSARIPLVVFVVSLITFLVLIVVLRALILPLIAVLLNLLTVAAAFGVLAIIPHVPGLSIGGDGYMDAVGAVSVFGVVFGLSIDYAVFLLARMREGRSMGLDNEEAISFGLEKTAGVITGAAAIMAGVFVAFATAKIDTVSQVGIALTVAVILDATVIRLILLPALMKLIGEKVWWLPAWLERALPQLDLEGRRAPATEKLA